VAFTSSQANSENSKIKKLKLYGCCVWFMGALVNKILIQGEKMYKGFHLRLLFSGYKRTFQQRKSHKSWYVNENRNDCENAIMDSQKYCSKFQNKFVS